MIIQEGVTKERSMMYRLTREMLLAISKRSEYDSNPAIADAVWAYKRLVWYAISRDPARAGELEELIEVVWNGWNIMHNDEKKTTYSSFYAGISSQMEETNG